jgi:hypothetical protein
MTPLSKVLNEPRLGFVKEHGSKRRPVKGYGSTITRSLLRNLATSRARSRAC